MSIDGDDELYNSQVLKILNNKYDYNTLITFGNLISIDKNEQIFQNLNVIEIGIIYLIINYLEMKIGIILILKHLDINYLKIKKRRFKNRWKICKISN